MIDLDAFADDVLDTGAFAQEAVLSSATGGASTIKGELSKEYSAPEGVGIVGVSDAAPVFLCKESDVTDAKRGDSLTIGEVAYVITEVMPNGDGFATLRLSEE